MDDLISRQAAIDALGAEPEVWINDDDYAMGANNQWHYDVNALKAVLSAEPTYNDGDIQKMQDLEQAQLEKAYQLGYEEGKKDAQPEERTGNRTETRACDSIRRQDAIDALIRKMKPHDNGDGTMTIYVMSERLVKETLNDLPVAQQKRCEDCENFSKTRSLIPQPERKTGRWIVIPAPDDLHCGLVKCPFCGELLVGEPNEYNFCSNCGADMRGEDNG